MLLVCGLDRPVGAIVFRVLSLHRRLASAKDQAREENGIFHSHVGDVADHLCGGCLVSSGFFVRRVAPVASTSIHHPTGIERLGITGFPSLDWPLLIASGTCLE